MNKFYAILLLTVSIVNCSKEHQFYNVQIENGYFEQIQEIKLDTLTFGFLEPNQISDTKLLSEGSYEFRAKTESNLHFTTWVNIAGQKSNILLYIDKNGRLKKNNCP